MAARQGKNQLEVLVAATAKLHQARIWERSNFSFFPRRNFVAVDYFVGFLEPVLLP